MPVSRILAYVKKMDINLSSLKPVDLETIYPAATELANVDEDF